MSPIRRLEFEVSPIAVVLKKVSLTIPASSIRFNGLLL